MSAFKFRRVLEHNNFVDQKCRRRKSALVPPCRPPGQQLVWLFNILSTSLRVRQSVLMASKQVHNTILMKQVLEEVREGGEGCGGGQERAF